MAKSKPVATKSLTLVVALEYDVELMHGDDLEAKDWFFEEILGGDHLTLHDNGDLGDEVGKVKLIYWVKPGGE